MSRQMLFNADGKIKKYDHTSDILSTGRPLQMSVMTEQPGSYRSYHEVQVGGHEKFTKDSALDILREFADVRLSIYETPMPQVATCIETQLAIQ